MTRDAAAPKVALGEVVYGRLKGLIESGELPPGTSLREVQLAERLEVSRTPVREALRRLEADGLVTFEPRAGMIVASLDPQRVVELYTFLEALEGMAAGLMAKHAGLHDVETLQALVAQERPGSTGQELSAINKRLHGLIYSGARNRYLETALHSTRNRIFLLGKTTLGNPGRYEAAHQEHLQLVEAIASGDGKAAEEVMRAHIRAALRERLKMITDASG